MRLPLILNAPWRTASGLAKQTLTHHRQHEAIKRRDAGKETLGGVRAPTMLAVGRFRGPLEA